MIELRRERRRRGDRPPAGGLVPARAREPERRDRKARPSRCSVARTRSARRGRSPRSTARPRRAPRSRSTDTKPARSRAPRRAIQSGWRSAARCSESCCRNAASPAGPGRSSSAPAAGAARRPARDALRPLRVSDRVAGGALRRVRRTAPRLRLRPGRGRLRRPGRALVSAWKERGLRPRGRPRRRPGRRDGAAAAGRRPRVRPRRRGPRRLARREHRPRSWPGARACAGSCPSARFARPCPPRPAPARPLPGRAPRERPGCAFRAVGRVAAVGRRWSTTSTRPGRPSAPPRASFAAPAPGPSTSSPSPAPCAVETPVEAALAGGGVADVVG